MRNKGFTLIELLVAISIIGILSTLLISNLQDARSRARDAVRKSNLKEIKTALRMYYNDYQGYPAADGSGSIGEGCNSGVCSWGEDLFGTTGETVYMNTLPQDPLGSDRSYYYTSSADGESFDLYACLENRSDSEIVDCDDNMTTCTNNSCFHVGED